MIFDNILKDIPLFFIVAAVAISALYLIWMIVDLLLMKQYCSQIRRDVREIDAALSLHQGCNIENLPLISDIFDESLPKLSQAYNEMLQTSSDLYQKKWIPNPKDFIHARSVVSTRFEKKLFGSGHLYYLFVGLFLCTVTNIVAALLFDTKEAISSALILSSLPLILAVLFWLLFTIEKSSSVACLTRSLDGMIHTLALKLPVFSENNGMAILVNQFMEYDRSMTLAVDKLTGKMDHFANEGLTAAVSESIEKTLLESVAPSIDRSSNALIALSQEISNRESDGMKELAVQFTSAVTSEMAYQFAPLVSKIQEVSTTLANSKNYFDIITQSLENYKANLTELNHLTSESMKSYEESKASFSGDVHTISQTLQEFSSLSSLYLTSVESDIQHFGDASKDLYERISENNRVLESLLQEISKETEVSKEQSEKSHRHLESYLTTMDQQMSRLSREFSDSNNELISGLSAIIDKFLKQQTFDTDLHHQQLGSKYESLLKSIDETVKAIRTSSDQLKAGFDELEAARLREEEHKRSSFFGRKRK